MLHASKLLLLMHAVLMVSSIAMFECDLNECIDFEVIIRSVTSVILFLEGETKAHQTLEPV